MAARTRIAMPETAKKGDVIEIKSLIQHVMETGYRRDYQGLAIPRDIIKTFVVTYAGEEVFRADMTQGIAANPFFSFHTVAVETGDVVFKWTDLKGKTTTVARRLTVTG
ncbi:MAG: thiosulfate oxidation carrier complex protein SoxZ [Hyphomicrobiaceae bacterium]